MKPEISIIIPVYNAEKYLAECLESIISQTFADIEVLCINDGSKDSSLEILNTFAAKDKRIKVFSQENSGPAKARNVGLENAQGEFLMFCDSDDTYEPTMCEDMLTAIKTHDVDFVMCDVNMIEVDHNHGRNQGNIDYHRLHYKGSHQLTTWLKTKINVLVWNKIFRMSILKKYSIVFPPVYQYEDNSFSWEYLNVCNTFYGLDKKLYNYKIHNNSLMSKLFTSKTDTAFDKIYVLKHFLNFLKNNNLLANNLFLLSCIQGETSWACPFLKEKDQKKFLNLLNKEVVSEISADDFNETAKDFKQLQNFLKTYLQSHKKPKLFGKYIKNNVKRFYFFGIPIFKKKKTEQTKSYYLFGIKIFYKKKNNHQQQPFKNIMQKLDSINYKTQMLNLMTADNTPNKDRTIICFDCLYDKGQEAIDAYSLFCYLQQNHIPSKYILLKGNKLEAQLANNPDVIIVNNKDDFINNAYLIRKSRYIITSFGFAGSPTDKMLKNLSYLDYVYIGHGVMLMKKWMISMYNPNNFDKILVPTSLTHDLYQKTKTWAANQMILSGMPRWDLLQNNRNNHIFVFFTWRKTFMQKPQLSQRYLDDITKFLAHLSQIVKDKTIIDVAFHHELLRNNILCEILKADNINLIDTANISQAIQNSSMLITDYSSVSWDFMYQDKPVIFYRFDKDELYLDDIDQQACIGAMQEDNKLYNCLYAEKDVLNKVEYYLSHNFELEPENKTINKNIFWQNKNNCETLYKKLTQDTNIKDILTA